MKIEQLLVLLILANSVSSVLLWVALAVLDGRRARQIKTLDEIVAALYLMVTENRPANLEGDDHQTERYRISSQCRCPEDVPEMDCSCGVREKLAEFDKKRSQG